MYLIQETTKQPTEEILGFFYDLGMRVGELGIEKMEGRGIRKDIRDDYPGTSIPFKLMVKGRRTKRWTPTGWSPTEEFSGDIEVTFPDKSRGVDQKALMDKIVERTLLDGESLPNFPKPKSRTPKMYAELIKQILQNKDSSNEKSKNET